MDERTNEQNGGDIGNPSEPIDPSTLGTGDSGDGFDPSKHVSRDKRNKDGSFTLKRGRKSGSGSGSKKASAKGDLKTSVDALSNMLMMVHLGLSNATKTPELEIDKSEGDLLANAGMNVLKEFDVTPDPKTQAIFGLIVACGTVYGPRVVTVRMRKSREKEEEKTGDIIPHNDGPLDMTNLVAVNGQRSAS